MTLKDDGGVAILRIDQRYLSASDVSGRYSLQSCIGLFGVCMLCFCFGAGTVSLTSVSPNLNSSI